MSITASLAWSQLKGKRVRSLATILAVILSTSLTTAVCSFVVSANAMLVDLLGTDYGTYGGAYFSMLLIPAVLFGILIIMMSVIVISNAFRVSAAGRLVQFGTLKCVGATKKQIMETVMYEGVFLSLIGVPCGIVLGVIFSHFGIGIANIYLDDLNSLVDMMMTKFTISLKFAFSWEALLLSAGISVITVLLSAYLPAKHAAKKSAVECMKPVENVEFLTEADWNKKSLKGIGGIEVQLALVEVRRNRRNTKSSVMVLTISIILFLSLSGLKDIAERVEEYIYPKTKQTVIVDYTSYYDKRENPITGRREVWYSKPIDSILADEIVEDLRRFDEENFIGMGVDYDTYFVVFDESLLTFPMKKALAYEQGQEQEQESYEFPVEIIVLDKYNYEKICHKAGIEAGGSILLNHYSYNNHGTKEEIIPFSESLETISLETADGTSTEISIDGILNGSDIPEELFYLNTNPVRLIMPEATVRGYTWQAAPSDIESFMAYANEVMDVYFPQNDSDAYREIGFTTRVYQTDDYAKVMNIAIVLASVFLYSFVVLLALIGVINVISTMSANVQMREREFAVLQSIGMTPEQLKKMLNVESILCSGKAVCYGLPIGVLLIIIMNYAVLELFPIGFSISWKSIAVVIAGVFLLIWSTIRIAAKRVERQNIIETIRI